MTLNNCPCGSKLTYQDCCEPLHLGVAIAESAQQLMRSRYAAFVTNHIDYLICTHSPQTRSVLDKNEISQWASSSQWLALDIRDSQTTGASAQVEFVAWYKTPQKLHAHHELSQFSYEAIDPELSQYCKNSQATHAWYYHSALPSTTQINLPKRNDSCICSSGKKFKKCCGA